MPPLTRSRKANPDVSMITIISDDDMTEEDESQEEYEERMSLYSSQRPKSSTMMIEAPTLDSVSIPKNVVQNTQTRLLSASFYLQELGGGIPNSSPIPSCRGIGGSLSQSSYSGSGVSAVEPKRKFSDGKENEHLDGEMLVSNRRTKRNTMNGNGMIHVSEQKLNYSLEGEARTPNISAPARVSSNQCITSSTTPQPSSAFTSPLQHALLPKSVEPPSDISMPSKEAKRRVQSTGPRKLTKKEQEKLERERQKRENDMTYAQFIDYLSQKIKPERRSKYPQIFNETMALHGARLVTRYTKEVTHIVLYQVQPEQEKAPNPVINVPISYIPLRVKIVWGKWLSKCQASRRLLDVCMEDHVFWDRFHAEQTEGRKIDLTNAPAKRQKREEYLDSEDEEMKEKKSFKKQKSRGLVVVNQTASSTSSKERVHDPTDEFLLAAATMDSDDDEDGAYKRKGKYSNFQCMQKGGQLSRRQPPNQDIIEELQKLANIHAGQLGDEPPWKERTLVKAVGTLRRHPKRIESLEEAMSLYGIGKKTAEKIMEIVETGKLKRIDYEMSEVDLASQLFQGIYGVGRQLGYDWSRLGLRSLDDVRQRKCGIKLTPAQEIGLKYYDDLNTRMPRQEAKDIFDKIHGIALFIDTKLSLELMGSYRRGRETCGDIDILITRDPSDGHDHASILPILLQRLHKEGILVADLGGEESDGLEVKYMGLCRRSPEGRVRRIDILTIPFEQWGAALVYFTGDDIFNRSMRLLANKMGMSLNQRGLWEGVIRDPKTRQKTATGRIIASRTEQEIFQALGVPWQESHERIRS